ncbi:MAG: tyrosine-type recombinase/integrase [Planctomycetes bacterium]|nr:tyrosine-type recombinase/integrase [Planctomycetota bacterium]
MGRAKKPARIRRWRGEWYLFYTDYSTGRQVRVACSSLKAFNAEQRKDLEQEYRGKEVNERAEVLKRGGGLAYDRLLIDEIDDYLEATKKREKAREANPKARSGLSAKTSEVIHHVLGHFKSWLESKRTEELQTGHLDGPTLTEYVDDLASEPARLGNRKGIKRSPATVNAYIRTLKTCLAWINSRRPPRFPDYAYLANSLKPLREDATTPTAYSPEELQAFLEKALEREQPNKVVEVRRAKSSTGKSEKFQMRTVKNAVTPVSRLFVLLALTGCRVGEALSLKWTDVDLDRGRITIRAQKTGRTRWLPLAGAPEGDVAPGLVKLLKQWREEDEAREFVLPHDGLDGPVFPKGAWKGVNDATTGPRITPQRLRQNFTSYAASLGIPAAVSALWQGHGTEVAEKHYRAQVLDRRPGTSFEHAMGLDEKDLV